MAITEFLGNWPSWIMIWPETAAREGKDDNIANLGSQDTSSRILSETTF